MNQNFKEFKILVIEFFVDVAWIKNWDPKKFEKMAKWTKNILGKIQIFWNGGFLSKFTCTACGLNCPWAEPPIHFSWGTGLDRRPVVIWPDFNVKTWTSRRRTLPGSLLLPQPAFDKFRVKTKIKTLNNIMFTFWLYALYMNYKSAMLFTNTGFFFSKLKTPEILWNLKCLNLETKHCDLTRKSVPVLYLNAHLFENQYQWQHPNGKLLKCLTLEL